MPQTHKVRVGIEDHDFPGTTLLTGLGVSSFSNWTFLFPVACSAVFPFRLLPVNDSPVRLRSDDLICERPSAIVPGGCLAKPCPPCGVPDEHSLPDLWIVN